MTLYEVAPTICYVVHDELTCRWRAALEIGRGTAAPGPPLDYSNGDPELRPAPASELAAAPRLSGYIADFVLQPSPSRKESVLGNVLANASQA